MSRPRECCWSARVGALVLTLAALPAQEATGADSGALRLPPAEARRTDDPAELIVRLRDQVPEIIDRARVPGLAMALIRDRRIVWQGAFGVRVAGQSETVTDDTIFEAASMSKPLFTYAVLRLVEEGRFDLDRSLDDYLPEPYLPDQPLAPKITARMVLVHTTGLPNWREGGYRKGGPMPVRFEPGTRYGYSGEGFTYLQTAVEQVSSQKLSDFMQTRLLEHLGMRRSSYRWRAEFEADFAGGHDREGKPKTKRGFYERGNAAYSLYTTAGDYARFLLEMMDPDRSADHSLCSESITSMTTVQFEQESEGKRERVVRALGWVLDPQTGHVNHSGSNGSGFKCKSRFLPARGSGVVIMTNSAGGDRAWGAILEVIDADV